MKAAAPASDPPATLTPLARLGVEVDLAPPLPPLPPFPPAVPEPLGAGVVDELDSTTVELPPTLTVKEVLLP